MNSKYLLCEAQLNEAKPSLSYKAISKPDLNSRYNVSPKVIDGLVSKMKQNLLKAALKITKGNKSLIKGPKIERLTIIEPIIKSSGILSKAQYGKPIGAELQVAVRYGTGIEDVLAQEATWSMRNDKLVFKGIASIRKKTI